MLEELPTRGWLLGGEGSGHLLALDKHTTGDGIVSSLQVLQAVRPLGPALAEMLHGVSLFTQTLINVRLGRRADWSANRVLTAAPRLTASWRQRPRADPALGTEPLVRVMVEALDPALSRGCAERLAAALA